MGVTKQQYLISFGLDSLPRKMGGRVSFKGRLSHLETIKFIKSSDYSIFFRNNNLATKAGFPVKFVESIACGTPVITNSTSNIKDCLIDGKLGYLLDDTSESTLVESLNKVIELPKIRIEHMKKKCLNSNTFMYQNYIDDFEIFIKKAVNEDEK